MAARLRPSCVTTRLPPWHADGDPDSPSGTRLPVAWPSPRQFAGILPANPAAPQGNERCDSHPGLLSPKVPPPIPRCSPPFRPQEGLRQNVRSNMDDVF